MKQSGILMHITSLPSRGGIGTLGSAAYAFIDFLKSCGMTIWQVLPVGPTGYAESPYQSVSTYAGNPLLIDFELLEKNNLLPAGAFVPSQNAQTVDFEAVKAQNTLLLEQSFRYAFANLKDEVNAFAENHPWVRDYALFCAIKEHFNLVSWMEWPDEDIRLRKPESVKRYSEQLSQRIDFYIYGQYLFFEQWNALHDYARKNGISLMGDMPIYVSEDSSDVWLNPELFELDDDCRPIRIAGVPPDYFQENGQRWGNPLYRWDVHEKTGFEWWIQRLRAAEALFDCVRIDHFIGFANYYAIPATEPTAKNGRYEPGPGRKLFRKIKKELPNLKIVAEDLGVVSPKVKRLLNFCGYPGMKVLQFAFDSDDTNGDLPQHHCENCIVYTGTHDNNTTMGWWAQASDSVKAFARRKLGMPEDSNDILPHLLNAAFASCADTVIIPMQDWLALDESARMNYPGTVGGNWLWRMMPQNLDSVARRIRILNRKHHRGTLPEIDASDLVLRTEEILMERYHVSVKEADAVQIHEALSSAVMLRIAPKWADDSMERLNHRHALYFSAEYLVGRLIYNNLFSLGVLEDVKSLLGEKGFDLAELEDIEDAALGNGGLGRLAACFLDSAATHEIPLDGYGLRYRYGLFKQSFKDYRQNEAPDDWTRFGDPWSIRRDALSVIVEMKNGSVRAVPYDMPIIGYHGAIGTLRLWQTESLNEFDFERFNAQDYAAACKNKNAAEDVTKLLYPNDTMNAGKLLRIRQQYVLCSASLQDMLRTFRQNFGTDYDRFPQIHAVQLNDTHPAMAIPELIRLLMAEGLSFARAFTIAQKTFNYTNHTVMREALETWDEKLLKAVSPDLVRVIRRIQTRLAGELKKKGVTDTDGLNILADGRVHMANLSVYGTLHTNGVAAIHSQILKDDVFREWYALYPERFCNKTNGITQRRWLGLCNPELCKLLDSEIGEGYLTDLYRLELLKPKINEALAEKFMAVKLEKKRSLSALIAKREGVEIPVNFVYDVQIKRLHEYKRQLLNAFSVLDIYYSLKDGSLTDFPPTAFIFGAKSAPGYDRAKAIIRFINQIAEKVNADSDVNDKMRVVFVQNYNCSYAEHIIPAADLSEQISPAGTEASGTGNMKLMLNGACTLGTYDGANIEIVEQAGEENNFIFGATVDEINRIKPEYNPKALYESNPRIRRVVDALNTFDDPDGALHELYTALLEGASWHQPDHYFLLLDFESYMEAKLRAIRATQNKTAFAMMCLNNIAGAGKFSSDRTIAEYAEEIWKL